MPKLYFRYGVVSSAKTANLLLVSHNYSKQGKNILLLKPSIDNRSGISTIYSRAGLQEEADIVITDDIDLLNLGLSTIDCILCDEAQFISPKHIKQLRIIATTKSIPVICYGLRTNYQGELFPGSYTLMCLADSIEEIKTICNYCNKKAIMNLKLSSDGKPTTEGDGSPDLGFEEKYLPVCYGHYLKMTT